MQHDSSLIEVEPYEEIVENNVETFSTPTGSRSSSPVSVDRRATPDQYTSKGPAISVNSEFRHASVERCDPEELASKPHQIPFRHTDEVAALMSDQRHSSGTVVTLAPERGARMMRLQHEASNSVDRPMTAPMTVEEMQNVRNSEYDRPRSAPISWMTAITDKVNALWHMRSDRQGQTSSAVADLEADLPEVPRHLVGDREPLCQLENRENHASTVRTHPLVPTVVEKRHVWRLDSDTDIDLNNKEKRPSPELDLTVPPRVRRRSIVRVVTDAETERSAVPIRQQTAKSDGRNQRSSKVKSRSRTTNQRDQRRDEHSYSRRDSSRRRSSERRREKPTAAKPVTSEHQTRKQTKHRGSPPDDSSASSDSDNGRRRDRDRKRGHDRRRDNNSPDSSLSGGDSSSEEDETEDKKASKAKQLRIKLQKFDGTTSWESWWAHFQNCSTYNQWSKYDRLSFMKGALTGSAAQVLWDTDRSITNSFSKLTEVLKNRYGGERQAEKHRAELHLRRRKTHEGLSDLHQDIRRLTVLAYPKLSAEAREEIASDRFVSALGDPEFELKVKERAPKSLDEVLCIALRLEAWAKSVKPDKHEEDRSERGKHKIRATVKPEISKQTVATGSTDRMAKMEAEMNKMRDELKKLSTKPRVQKANGNSQGPPQWRGPPHTVEGRHQPLCPISYPSYESHVETRVNGQVGEDRQQLRQNAGPPIPPQWQGPTHIVEDRHLPLIPNAANAQPQMQHPPIQNASNGQGRSNRSFQPQAVMCWACGLPGHISRNCIQRGQANTDNQSNVAAANRSSRKRKKQPRICDESYVYITLEMASKSFPCLLDSGCEATMVPRNILTSQQVKTIEPTERKIYAANDTPIQVEGQVTLPFFLNDQCIWINALVSEDIDEVMLGIDFLEQNNCVWNFKSGHVSINGQPAIALSRRGTLRCRRVLVQEYAEIPPRSQQNVTARVTLAKPRERFPKDMAVETNQVKPGLYVGRTLLPKSHRDVKVCVANTTSKPQQITPGSYLGPAVTVELAGKETLVSDHVASAEQSFSEIVQPTLEKLPSDITSEQRQRIVEFLSEYDDMFSRSSYDMGRTTLIEHTIDTGQNRPIRQSLRRHPYAHLEEIDRQVNELQQSDFIEPAASPWASNVVLVKKKDGSYRLCVDYRQLNSVTYKDSYPLPHIDTCLGSMNGAVWFSTLDLRSGYHNIPIREDDRDKTAFITRRGCFRYKVMPFGLTCAPSVFQRLMDLVLCGLTYETCLVYLDDIIVFSNDFDSHLDRLREIFDRLRVANLKLHMKKCCFFQRRVDFLGHVLTESGIEVQEDKVKAVQTWPRPRNLTELRSFVGLCSYYRRFIEGFASIAVPLHQLTRKNARFEWGPEQDEAFSQLKERLTTAPILGMPRDTGIFHLDTDASNVGLGAILSQEQDGQEVVLAYASRTLSRAERNYDVTRRELLAVVYGLKIYKQYLLGRQFVIRTDHSALQSLRKTPEPIGQAARWQTFIEQFSFSIVHRPGTRHQNADALSRRPVSDDSENEEDSIENVGRCMAATVQFETQSSEVSLAELQQQDPDIGPILRLKIQQIEQPKPESVIAESESVKVLWGQWHSLVVRDGVLYRFVREKYKKPSVLQLVVPTVKKTEFMQQCHEGMTGGHRAFRSTLEQVRRRGFWLGWRRDVERFCRQCQACSSYHRGRLPRSEALQPMITGAVMERIHVDITGPHPRTTRGSKYILSCVDSFSKWAECFPIANKEAKTVARVLVEQVFCRLGTPVALLTDNAGELDGHLMREICELLGIDKQRTSFYRPQTNSVAERFHGTLNAMMGRVVSESQKDWDLQLPFVMAAYRATVHSSTNFSPNYLMLTREVRAPVDLVFDIPTDPPPTSYDDYTLAVEDRMRLAYALVRKHLGVFAERMKQRYDLRVKPQKFRVGEWVLYHNPRKLQGKQNKWVRKFSPYLVIKTLPPVNYLLQKNKRSKPMVAHADKLKKWNIESPPKSWLTNNNAESNEMLFSVDTEVEPVEVTEAETSQHDMVKSELESYHVQDADNEVSASWSGDADQSNEVNRIESIIAGDPSSTAIYNRPRREIRMPARYRE